MKIFTQFRLYPGWWAFFANNDFGALIITDCGRSQAVASGLGFGATIYIWIVARIKQFLCPSRGYLGRPKRRP